MYTLIATPGYSVVNDKVTAVSKMGLVRSQIKGAIRSTFFVGIARQSVVCNIDSVRTCDEQNRFKAAEEWQFVRTGL